ncbi:aminoglycoside 6-adenylyltransferase [Floricoccus penangensis]|uniref:aminoglycoside 6-adenylyltransferase n=1 Tax=Floricoccus penangensis TaxID=1859475 RepID=UPI00204224AA|nr:aminoglycoside 6-adenylyltransferase [Floricoccus penangensis]URZ87023.1 aminoglycoside 6-adenylyltransferase [Floricoccus penangensis]
MTFFEKIEDYYKKATDIELVAMNGSRVNPEVTPDKFQDYDLVFFTNDVEKYRDNPSFLERFGKIMIMTEPDGEGQAGPLTYPNKEGYTYLVQYEDGNRLDLQIMDISLLKNYLIEDSLTKIVLDKKGIIESEIIPNSRDYYLNRPNQIEVENSVKEFYWQFNNVLKANLRSQFLYSQEILNLVRNELILLISWNIGFEYGFERNLGKANNKILDFIDMEDARLLKESYNTSSKQKIFSALRTLKNLEIKYLKELDKLGIYTMDDLLKLSDVPVKYLQSTGVTDEIIK